MKQQEIVTSGLSGDTNIIDTRNLGFIKLQTALMVSAGTEISTFGITPELIPTENKIQYIVEMQANGLKNVQISNGLVIKCTPNTHFLSDTGWVPLMLLEKNDNILSSIYTKDGRLEPEIYCIDSISEASNGSLFEPVFGVITTTGSIMIPHLDENAEELSLVPVLQ